MRRKVEIFKWTDGYPQRLISTDETGYWHQWGCNYEEFETGPGNFSTAIIEMPNGVVRNIPVEQIKFIT